MLKRTLWYACLVLLCCGISVLVVLATSATKTTLVPTDATSTASRAATDGLFSQSAPMTGTPVAKPQEAVSKQTRLQPDVPSPSTHLDLPLIPQVEKVSEESKVSEAASKADEKEPNEARTREASEPNRKDSEPPREELESQAREMGYDPEWVRSLSDADLKALIAEVRRGTSAVKTDTPEAPVEAGAADAPRRGGTLGGPALDEQKPEEQAKATEAPRGPVATDEPTAEKPFSVGMGSEEPGSAPVFGSAGGAQTSGNATVPPQSEEQLKTAAQDVINRMESGQEITPADKAVIEAWDRVRPRVVSEPRYDNHLDNDGTWFTWTGSAVVPPTGTGGSDSALYTTDVPLVVSGGGPIFDIDVKIDSMRHTYDGDLSFTLMSPTGTKVVLINLRGLGDENFIRTVLDDEASTAISAGAAPFTGSFIPEQPLSAFDNEDPNGTWHLTIWDHANLDSGRIFQWSMQLEMGGATFANDYRIQAITSPSGRQNPSFAALVTARFQNYGTTTQACSVKYQFNGGTLDTEVTGSLVTYAIENHSFSPTITMPATPGLYELVVWADLSTDQDRSNDTMRAWVNVNYDGFACTTPYQVLTVGPDSLSFNNTGAGNNTPGQMCQTTAYNDMVFKMFVPDGDQGEFWFPSTLSNYHSLKWGGACSGSNLIACVPNSFQKLRYVNHTGSGQDIFLVIGGASSTAGNFKMAWERQTTSTYTPPFADGFEIVVVQPTNPTYHTLPNYWSVENGNGDANTWENYNSGAAFGTYCAYSYNGTSTGGNEWLFSPGLDLNGGTTYLLEYYRKAYIGTKPDSLEVRLGTSNASSAMTTSIVPWDSFKTTTWVKKYGAITPDGSGTYYLGFHDSTHQTGAGCYLDSVRVTAMPTNDYATLVITTPTTSWQPPNSVVPVTATFQNLGSTTEACSVRYQFNGGAIISDSMASLAPAATRSKTFGTSITMPSTPDTFELVVWTDLPTDLNRANDTLRRQIIVGYDAYTCTGAYPLTTAGPDSATWNNTGAGDNTPGQACWPTNSYRDMVFSMDVPDGQQGEIWQTSGTPDFTQTLRWGSPCPGSNAIECNDTPDEKQFRYVNHSGLAQTIYYTCGGYFSTSYGNFKLAWRRVTASSYSTPYSSGFEITVAPPLVPYYTTLPDYWSVENSNGDKYAWNNNNSGALAGTYCALKGSGAISDDWLFTPGLSLTTGATYYFEYYRKAYSGSSAESLEVKIGTQNASSAMTQSVMAFDSFKTTTWVKKSAAFTVGSPGTYYIGFHSYTRNSGGGCYLDSVSVRQLPAHDYVTNSITGPVGIQAPSASVSVTALFQNWGATAESCSVRYQFNAGAIVSESTPALGALGIDNHTFVTLITLPASPGFYPLKVWTDLPTDTNRNNDTVSVNVNVNLSGWDCANVFTVTTAGPESLSFNNSGAGNNTPGVSCYATAYNDMVFTMSLANDQQGEFWLSSALTNYHSLKWGGACPGTNQGACVNQSLQKLRYVNHTGSAQNVYFVVGATSATAGNFKLAWQQQATSAYNLPYANGFENPILQPTNPTYHTLPNYWSIENTNGDMYAWENNTTVPYSGGNCARSYCGVATGNDDWLFTPGLNLTTDTTYYVEYYRKAYSSSYPESLEVKVGTENKSLAMTTSVVAWDSFKTVSWVKKYGTFVATSTGPHYVGFHSWTRRSGYGGYLDSVRVLKLSANDFRTTAITSPTTGLQAPNSLVNVTATFQNFGLTTQACSVRYQFDGGAIVSDTTSSLSTFQTQSRTFSTQITMPGTPGTYPLRVWTDLPTDQDRSNDTLLLNVNVQWDGFTCATAYPLTTAGPDSLTFNNCGAGDNSPNQPCGTTSASDMVFYLTVPDGEQGEIWVSSNAIDSRGSLRWGGACPGTTTIDCQDTPDEKKYRFVNHTGSPQNIYYTYSYWTSGATCGALKLAWYRQADVPSSIPFSSGFEVTPLPTYHVFPNYWSVENLNGDMYVWENYNSGAYSGSRCARAYCANTAGNDDWLFTPGLILNNTSTYYLEYYRKAYSTTIPESLEVKIGTQNAAAAMTQTVVPWDSFKTNLWVQKYATFTVSTPDTYYIGFHSYVRRSGGGSYLDSVNLYEGACGAPTVTVNAGSGTTFYNLTATASGGWGGAIQYQWFTGVGCTDGNQIAGANLSTYLATASGDYSVRAWRADSVACDSCDSAQVTLSNPCTAITPPYSESFDTTSSVWATCWSQVNANGDATLWAPNITTPLTSPNCMYIAGTAAGNDDWLFSEPLSLTADTTYVLEYWRRSASATNYDSMSVMFGGARLPIAMVNTILAADTSMTTIYVLKSALFVPTVTGTYHIGFHSMSKSTLAGTRIDSVRVNQGICAAPTVTVNSATGTNFATLTAAATGGYGGALQYQWFTGDSCLDGNQIPYATASTYLATASGIYSVRAWRRDSVTCANCDSAEVTLSAACTAVVPEYIETFDDSAAGVWTACWSQENRNGDATAWAPSNSNYLDAPNCMYIAGTSGNDDWLFSESVTLSSDTTYVLEYWRRSVSSTAQDSLRVMYGTQRLSGAMLNTIFPADTCKTTAYRQKEALFTPPATADYYLGFHSRTKSSSAGTRIDSVHLYAFGPCAAPSVTVTGGTATFYMTLTANVSGGHGGPARYQWYTDAPPQIGNEIVGATTATYATSVSDTFSCAVARGPVDSTQCSGWDSAVVVITCETPSVPMYFQGFETAVPTALPTCWSQENTNGDAYTWGTYRSATYAHRDSTSARIQYNTGAAMNDWLFSSKLQLSSDTTYYLEYWYNANTTSYRESLEVKLGSLPTSASMTTTLQAGFGFTGLAYQRGLITFAPPSTGTYHIGWHGCSITNQYYIYLDDIRVWAAGACAAPDSVRVPATLAVDSVTLTATVYGGWGAVPTYQWYTGVGCLPGNGIVGATAATYKTYVTGDFSFRVYFGDSTTCVGCDSAHAEVISCLTYTAVPMFENFEARPTPSLPYCWTQQNLEGSSYAWVTSTSYPHWGTKSANVYQYSSPASNDWMYSRGLQLTAATTYYVGYWYRSSSSSYTSNLEVKLGRAQLADSMTVAIVDTQFAFTTITYTYREKPFVPPATGVYYLGWHGSSAVTYQSAYICVDDIAVYQSGTCTAPDSVKVNSVTGADSATLRCTVYGGTGGTPVYQWYTGAGCVNGNQVTGATLDSLRVYSSGVYSCRAYRVDSVNCAGCGSGTATVINCTAGVYAPMSEGFESVTVPALPVCWTKESFNAPSDDWMTSTSYPRTGTKSAYISWDLSLPLDDWLYSIAMNLSSDTTYNVSYWYRAGSTTYTERLALKAGRVATRDSMLYTLTAPFTFNTTTYTNREESFTPPVSGRYYFGWHASSDVDELAIYLDDIMVYAQGSCVAPDSVRANAVSGYVVAKLTANVYGGIGGAAQYRWYTGDSCRAENLIAGETGQSFYATASGLYSVKGFRFDSVTCARCDSVNATVRVDSCGPVSITPMRQKFDSVTAPTLPRCWSQKDDNADATAWVTSTTAPYSSPNHARIYGVTAGNNDWLFTPWMKLDSGTTYVVNYYRRVYSASYPDSLEIKYGVLPAGPYMTTLVAAADTCKRTAYVGKEATFTPTVTDTFYVGFHSLNKGSSSAYTYLDDVMLFAQGSCGAPDSVRANAALGMLYVKLTANVYGGYGGVTQYQWYTGDSCRDGNEISGENAKDYYATTSGLYSVKAWLGSLSCAACDTATATVNPDTCLPVSIAPFFEDFEAVTTPALPYCWKKQDVNADATTWNTTTTFAYSGTKSVYIYYNSTTGNDDWLYTTPMVLTGSATYRLEYMRRTYYSYGRDSLEIKYGTIPVNTFMTNVITTPDTVASTTFLYKTATFTPSVTDTYYVGFHSMNKVSSSYTYLDNVSLYLDGTCAAPTVTVNDCTVTTGGATLKAVHSGGYGGTPVYQWYRGGQCIADSAIPGANTATYVTCVSGRYACRVYMSDSTACVGCDSADATIGGTIAGYDCCSPIYLTGSGQYTGSNCGYGNDSPGQICGASGSDVVFGLVVADGYTSRIHKTTLLGSGTLDSRTSLMANCGDLASTFPGAGLGGLMCIDDPDTTWWSYTNCTGHADTVYFIIGGYSLTSACTTFTIAWTTTQDSVCPDISCTPTVTESGSNNSCFEGNYFNAFTCGDVISGSVTATATTRDVDAYEMTTTEAKNITVSVTAEFDVAVQLRTDTVGTLCPDVYRDSVNNIVCGTETRTFYNVPAGIVHLVVYPPYKVICPSDYCMTVTCAAGTVPPGEDCSNPIVLTPPGPGGSTQVLGNNQGYVADYPDTCEYPGTAADVMYSLTVSSCRRLTFSVDTSGSMVGRDKFIEVFESGQCGGDAFLCNNDWTNFTALDWEGVGQRPTDSLGSFCGGELPAGTYYIRVSNAGSGPGPYKLTVYDNGACACNITCQGGDALETTESRYDTTFYRTDPDGGCLITPPAFGAINCGTTLCGVGFNYQRKTVTSHLNRDTDWYLFTIATRRIVTLTVNAEFPAIIGVVDTNNCLTPVAMFYDSAVPACTPTAVWDTLDPGTYAVAVAPRYFVGNPLPSTYRATLSCICIPGKKPTDVTCRFDSADGTPIGYNYWNDMRIRWTADSAMAGVGTYTIYYNLNLNVFPGGAGWTVLTTGITPVLGPHNTTYVDLNVVNATILRRYYVVVAVCE